MSICQVSNLASPSTSTNALELVLEGAEIVLGVMPSHFARRVYPRSAALHEPAR